MFVLTALLSFPLILSSDTEFYGNLYIDQLDKCLQVSLPGEEIDSRVNIYAVKTGPVGDCNIDSMFKFKPNSPGSSYFGIFNRNDEEYVQVYGGPISQSEKLLGREKAGLAQKGGHGKTPQRYMIIELPGGNKVIKGLDGHFLTYDPENNEIRHKTPENTEYYVKLIEEKDGFNKIVSTTYTTSYTTPVTTATTTKKGFVTNTNTTTAAPSTINVYNTTTATIDTHTTNTTSVTNTQTKTKQATSTVVTTVLQTQNVGVTTTVIDPATADRLVNKTVTQSVSLQNSSAEYIAENLNNNALNGICKTLDGLLMDKDVVLEDLKEKIESEVENQLKIHDKKAHNVSI